jgi:hypothetical protein
MAFSLRVNGILGGMGMAKFPANQAFFFEKLIEIAILPCYHF